MIFVSALPGVDPAPLGDDEPDGDRGRLVVGEHQRRQARPGAQAVAAADPGLAVDRDADVVQRDRVPADRPLGDTQVGRRRAAVDHRPRLEHLEEREQPGGGPGHTSDCRTTADKNCPQSFVGFRLNRRQEAM